MRFEDLLDPTNLAAPAPIPSPQSVSDWFGKAEAAGPSPLSIANDPHVKKFLNWMTTPEQPVYDPDPSPQPETRYLRDPAPPPRVEYRTEPRSGMRPR